MLSEQYEDFASKVGQHLSSVGLAEGHDDYDKLADTIVSSWRFVGEAATKTVKGVAVALHRILARASKVELSAAGVKTNWNPDKDDDLAGWARDNAALLVRDVDETTRKQLSTFLASELRAGHDAETIASNVRKHFADFPDWRSDLIAREETKRYYNAGTLFAAEASGSAQVQALDGQLGPTDPECEARHGRLFAVADAWQESEKEHVRGTLSWRIIPGQIPLSFSRSSSNEMAARIDRDERVIFLAEGLDQATEGRYLERAIDWLISSAR